MAATNYTITGHDFLIKSQFGETFQDGAMAIVQWQVGYDPAVRPLNEWVGNPIMVSWAGWYVKDYAGIGQGIFGSNGTMVSQPGLLYLFADFSNSNNYTPTMSGQVWMGQITDVLTLPGGDVVIDLNTANIRSVVGSRVGNTLIAGDWNTWQPIAVPEPSHYGAFMGVAMLVVAVFLRSRRQNAS